MADRQFNVEVLIKARNAAAGALNGLARDVSKLDDHFKSLDTKTKALDKDIKKLDDRLGPLNDRFKNFSSQMLTAGNRMEKFNDRSKEAASAARKLEANLTKLNDNVKTLNSNLRKTNDGFGAMGDGARHASRSTDKATESMRENARATENTRRSTRGAANDLERLADRQRVVQTRSRNLNAEFNDFQIAVVIKYAQALTTALTSLGGELVSVASSAVSAGSAIGAGLASGLAEALPVIGVVGSALERLRNVAAAVKLNQQNKLLATHNAAQDARDQATGIREVRSATDSLATAQEALANAHRNEQEAQEGVTIARADAVRQLQDLVLAEERARLAAEGASLAVEDSQRKLRNALASGDEAAIADARLGLKSSRLDQGTAIRDRNRAREDNALAQSGSILSPVNKSVISADRQLADAHRSVQDAARGLKSAEQGVSDAHNVAADKADKNTAAQDRLTAMLGLLSKAERTLYGDTVRLVSVWQKEGSKITDPITNSLDKFVRGVTKKLRDPSFMHIFTSLSETIAHQMDRIGKFLLSPQVEGFIREFARNAQRDLPGITTMFLNLAKAFMNIARAGRPIFKLMLDTLEGLSKKFLDATNNSKGMTRFLDAGEQSLRAWGHLISAVFHLFTSIFFPAVEEGNKSINQMADAIDRVATKFDNNQGAVKKFFEGSRQSFHDLLGVIGALLKELITVFSPSSVHAFADVLKMIAIPALGDAIRLMGFFTRAFHELLTGVPFVATLTRWAATILIVSKGFTILITTFAKLRGMMVAFFALAGNSPTLVVFKFITLLGAVLIPLAEKSEPLRKLLSGLVQFFSTNPAWAAAFIGVFIGLERKFGVFSKMITALADAFTTLASKIGLVGDKLTATSDKAKVAAAETSAAGGGGSAGGAPIVIPGESAPAGTRQSKVLGPDGKPLTVPAESPPLVVPVTDAALKDAEEGGKKVSERFREGISKTGGALKTAGKFYFGFRLFEGAYKAADDFARSGVTTGQKFALALQEPFKAIPGGGALLDAFGINVENNLKSSQKRMTDAARNHLHAALISLKNTSAALIGTAPGTFLGVGDGPGNRLASQIQKAQSLTLSKLTNLAERAGVDPASIEQLKRQLKKAEDAIGFGFYGLSHGVARNLGDLRGIVKNNMDEIISTYGAKSARGRELLVENTRLAIKDLKRLHDQHLIGDKEYYKELEALQHQYNLNAGKHLNVLIGDWTDSLVKGKGLTKKNVKNMLDELAQLPPGARKQGIKSMLDLAHTLETEGLVPDGTAKNLAFQIGNRFKGMSRVAVTHGIEMLTGITTILSDLGGTTYDAMKNIHDSVGSVLEGLGVKGGDFKVKKPKSLISTDVGKGLQATVGGTVGAIFRAGGGFLGNPGERGGDLVHAILGRGEAVLNSAHQKVVNSALYEKFGFGLSEMFQKVRGQHGSEAPSGLARGGFPDWGPHPALTGGIAKVVGVVQKKFPALTVSSTTDHSYLTTSGNVSDHTRGWAADVQKFGDAKYMYAAAEWIKRSGLYRSLKQGIHNPNLAVNAGQLQKPPGQFAGQTWAEHVSHIHLAVQGALGSFKNVAAGLGSVGAAFQTVSHIARQTFQGPKGFLKEIGQAGIDKATKAANKYLDKQGGIGGALGLGGPAPHVKGQYSVGQMAKLWASQGGDKRYANLMGWVGMAESHGSPTAHNNSGASGLWQILGAVLPGNLFDPVVNAKNAIKKFNDARPHPLAPWASSRGGWGSHAGGLPLAKGGFAKYAGAFGQGGVVSANRPSYLMFGENGPETAAVIPQSKINAAKSKGHYSREELVALWVAAGGPLSAAAKMVAIAWRESRGEAHARNVNTNGTIDRGLWQINSSHGSLSTFDPIQNAKNAVKLYKQYGLQPWALHGNPLASTNLGAAQRAVGQYKAGGGAANGSPSATGPGFGSLTSGALAAVGGEVFAHAIASDTEKLRGKFGAFQKAMRDLTSDEGPIAKLLDLIGTIKDDLDSKVRNRRYREVHGKIRDMFIRSGQPQAIGEAIAASRAADADLNNSVTVGHHLRNERGLVREALATARQRAKDPSLTSKQRADARREVANLERRLNTVNNAVGTNNEERYTAQQAAKDARIAVQQARADHVNDYFDRQGNKLQNRISRATARGQTSLVAQLAQEQLGNVNTQIASQTALLNITSDPKIKRAINEKIDELKTSAVELTANIFQGQIDTVNNEATRSLNRASLKGRMADVLQRTRVGNGDASFALHGAALQDTGLALTTQRDKLFGLLSQASQDGNEQKVAELTDQIADLNVQISENTVALQENKDALAQSHFDSVSNRQGFVGGILSGGVNILQGLSTLTGTDNSAAVKKLLDRTGDSLQGSQSSYEDQLISLVGDSAQGIRGLHGSDLINSVLGLSDTVNEDDFTPAQKSLYESLINAIISNEGALVDNTNQIAALTTTNDQSFSSTSWQWFRQAVFNGTGGLLPQYADLVPHMAVGGTVLSDGMAYLHANEVVQPAGIVRAGTGFNGEVNVNIDHPIEVADPVYIGKRIAFELKTAK